MEESPKPKLNPDQKAALIAIKEFLDHPTMDTFVLKGYAGTGKTFLMQLLGKRLQEKEVPFRMLASTGRAAAVLRGKTGFTTKTVHGELYHFSKVDGIEETMQFTESSSKNGQMSLQFATRAADQEKILYIVDEASMLSGDLLVSIDFFASFGSGVLLDDFFKVVGNNKVIFVGDPCQLPPVGQPFSPALDVDWLNSHHRVAVSFTLKTIERTASDNGILKLAGAVRTMADAAEHPQWIKLPAANLANIVLHPSRQALLTSYSETCRDKGMDEALAIAHANKTVHEINNRVRADRFGMADIPLQVSDVLLVTQNNYAVPLSNGDFVEILLLGEIKYVETMKFQRVTVRSLASEKEYNLLLALDILNSTRGNFTNDQQKTLMIDFSYRMRIEDIKANSAKYKEAMLKDEFLNCLRATYGYGVTCHKGQGGEWPQVYLFLDNKMYGMPPNELCKWWYTAITRAKKTLHLEKAWWVA